MGIFFFEIKSNVDSFKLKVEPLEAHNFFTWPKKVEIVPRGREIWKYDDPTDSVTGTLAGEAEQQNSDLDLGFILMSIDKFCKVFFDATTRPLEVWKTLLRTYSSAETAATDEKVDKVQHG